MDISKLDLSDPLKSGTFGDVYKYDSNKVIKLIKIKDDDIYKDAVDEIKLLKLLKKSKYIITFIGAYITNEKIFIFLELFGIDLHVHLENEKKINLKERKIISKQILLALKFLKEENVIHQDLKSRNILIKNNEIKICDFGSAVIIPEGKKYLEVPDYYVCTLTYRAPELLLEDKYYNYQIDMWSFGIIMLELNYDIKSLHDIVISDTREKETEVKIIEWILERFDNPTEETWPGFHELFKKRHVKKCVKKVDIFKDYDKDEINLIRKILTWPKNRIKVSAALKDKYFSS